MKTPHFKAFISYSHQDEPWARWLQKSLESYRIPKHLVGSQGVFGEVPIHLTPVFRDREDLSSASDLKSRIGEELAASETLIVICSPAAVQSRWVNEEIRKFKASGREQRIFALIVDGDPQSKNPEESCFPPALLEHADGHQHEPLAADARKYADGKTLAKLKLVAGILGIRLDELRRRDMQRRRKTWAIATATSLLLILLTISLALTAISSKKAAQMQRAGTEDLLSYMLGNLQSLDPIVGLEVVDQNNEQVMNYLKSLGFQQMDNDKLVETALSWREQGKLLKERGDLTAAMEPLQQSRAAFIELHQREGGSTRALFELGQAEFWVGYVHMDKGELDEAQASFTRYGAITRRLVNADPNNAEMVMELAYSLINLSALERARQNPDIEKSLQLVQSAMQYNQIALVLEPENTVYREELLKTNAFMADAWLETCDLGKAFQFRLQNVEMARQLSTEQQDNLTMKLELAYALSGLAIVQRQAALTDQAIDGLNESVSLLSVASDNDPGNKYLRWEVLWRESRIARIFMELGENEKAWELSKILTTDIDAFVNERSEVDFNIAVDYAEFKINYSMLAYRMGNAIEAETELKDATNRLMDLVREKPNHRGSRFQLARASFEHWVQTREPPSPEVRVLLQGLLQQDQLVKSCDDASLGTRLAIMNEEQDLARGYTEYLLSKGFFEPEFVRICHEYQLCD